MGHYEISALPWSSRGVLVKEYVGEISKSFDKFQVVPLSMKVFTTNLNGPLAPTVSRPSRASFFYRETSDHPDSQSSTTYIHIMFSVPHDNGHAFL